MDVVSVILMRCKKCHMFLVFGYSGANEVEVADGLVLSLISYGVLFEDTHNCLANLSNKIKCFSKTFSPIATVTVIKYEIFPYANSQTICSE